MNVRVAQELLNELGSSLETVEVKQQALLQFLKDKGIVSDVQLAPYLDQAGKASDVRWRAVRVRLGHLLSAEDKEAQVFAEKERAQEAVEQQQKAQEQEAEAKNERHRQGDEKPEPADRAAMEDKTQNVETKSRVEKDENKERGRDKHSGPKQEKNAA